MPMPCSFCSQARQSRCVFGPDFFANATHWSNVRPVAARSFSLSAASFINPGCGLYLLFFAVIFAISVLLAPSVVCRDAVAHVGTRRRFHDDDERLLRRGAPRAPRVGARAVARDRRRP